jgi:uncharacterized protein (DUF58 family)
VTPTRTRRWRGVVAVALVLAAAGLLAKRQALLSLATVGIVFGAYHRLTPAPSASVAVERSVSDPSPTDGDEVDVTVTLRNEGENTLFDCRVVDGVPPALAVVDEPARHATVLRSGSETTFSYTVVARHGKHSFEPATVVARDVAGNWELETEVDAGESVELDCTTPLSNSPLRPQTLDAVGSVTALASGQGLEFAQVREYRRGDAPGRIDWNRYAATGDLTTVEFREQRSASVVVLVDARACAYRSPPGETHAVDAAVSATEQLVDCFQRDRNHVGVASLGADSCYVTPGAGREHRIHLMNTLATHPGFASAPTGEDPPLDDQLDHLLERLGEDTQLVVVSPATDDAIVEGARRLEAHGHLVTFISPDVTATETPGERLAAVERRSRLHRLRQVGIPVVEWSLGDPLALAVADAQGVAT